MGDGVFALCKKAADTQNGTDPTEQLVKSPVYPGTVAARHRQT